MYSIAEIVLHIVMVMATMWIVDRYWRTFFEKKWNIYSIAIWIAFGIFQIFFEMNIGNINIGATLINI
ncbi:MAG TPA: hypothetical protein VJY54_01340 [Lachnospiraceae bacterium]|nr:hypothetical protein [Lachnospiraceae bacterium]